MSGFDVAYRDRIAEAIIRATITVSLDAATHVAILRSGEIIDACITAAAHIAASSSTC